MSINEIISHTITVFVTASVTLGIERIPRLWKKIKANKDHIINKNAKVIRAVVLYALIISVAGVFLFFLEFSKLLVVVLIIISMFVNYLTQRNYLLFLFSSAAQSSTKESLEREKNELLNQLTRDGLSSETKKRYVAKIHKIDAQLTSGTYEMN